MNCTKSESLDLYVLNIKNPVIKKRIEYMLKFYCAKSAYSKVNFYRLSVISLIGNALIPFINQIGFKYSNLLVSLISVIATIITGLITLFSLKDSWYRYRQAAEAIKMECILFSSGIGEYKDKSSGSREKILACKVEQIISSEQSVWKNNRQDEKYTDSEENNENIEG